MDGIRSAAENQGKCAGWRARCAGLDRVHDRGVSPDAGAASLILLVRVRSPEREAKAQEILLAHQAEAVRVHEVEVEKRLADLPLSSLRIDPWLGDERLGQP